MRTRIGVLVALIIAVIAVFVVTHRHADRDDVQRTGGSTAASGPHPTAASATQPRASIAGTVRDEAGTPIAGARVCADPTHGVELAPTCASTGADGAFTIAELVATTYEVAASASKFRIATYHPDGDRRRWWFALHPGEARTGVSLVLRTGALDLTGVVADVTGGPIAHASVRIAIEDRDPNGSERWSPPIVTDDKGAFSIWAAPGGARLLATASAYAPAQLDVTVPGHVTMLLTPESSIEGTVIGEDGAPIEGAEVSATAVDLHESARTDALGHFAIGHLVPTRYDVVARTADGFGRSAGSVRVGLASTTTGVVIKLHAAYRVAGRVLLGDRACAQPSVELHDVAHDRVLELEPDDDGRLHVDGVQRGTYAVHPRCDGGRAMPTPPLVVDRDRIDLTWSLSTGATIRGHVRTKAGLPVERATIEAAGDGPLPHAGGNDVTAADGSYRLDGLAPATYTITATAPHGMRVLTRTVAAAEVAELDIVLDEGATIRGVVVDPSGHGVSDVWVSAQGEHPAGVTTRSDGGFEIDLSAPGEYDVVASADWATALEGPHIKEHVVLDAGDTEDVRLVVDARSGKIVGTVTDADGKPVADAYVAAYLADQLGGAFWSFTDHHPTLTDANGYFELVGLALSATYTVHAYRKGGGETLASSVSVGTSIALSLPPTASIAGTARNADGSEADEILLQLRDKEHAVFRQETFDHTGGAFAVDDLPPGTYVISASTPDAFGVVDQTLAAGQRATGVAIVLERMVPVTGRLVASDAATPVAGIAVIAKNAHAGRGTTVTEDDPNLSAADGRFTTLAPPGDDLIIVFGRFAGWCARPIAKTITAPIDLGDITLAKCKL